MEEQVIVAIFFLGPTLLIILLLGWAAYDKLEPFREKKKEQFAQWFNKRYEKLIERRKQRLLEGKDSGVESVWLALKDELEKTPLGEVIEAHKKDEKDRVKLKATMLHTWRARYLMDYASKEEPMLLESNKFLRMWEVTPIWCGDIRWMTPVKLNKELEPPTYNEDWNEEMRDVADTMLKYAEHEIAPKTEEEKIRLKKTVYRGIRMKAQASRAAVMYIKIYENIENK